MIAIADDGLFPFTGEVDAADVRVWRDRLGEVRDEREMLLRSGIIREAPCVDVYSSWVTFFERTDQTYLPIQVPLNTRAISDRHWKRGKQHMESHE